MLYRIKICIKLIKCFVQYLSILISLPLWEFELNRLNYSRIGFIILWIFLLIKPAIDNWWLGPLSSKCFLISRCIPLNLYLLSRQPIRLFLHTVVITTNTSRWGKLQPWCCCCIITQCIISIFISRHITRKWWRRPLIIWCVKCGSYPYSSFIQLFLQVRDEIIVLFDLVLTLIYLSL